MFVCQKFPFEFDKFWSKNTIEIYIGSYYKLSKASGFSFFVFLATYLVEGTNHSNVAAIFLVHILQTIQTIYCHNVGNLDLACKKWDD